MDGPSDQGELTEEYRAGREQSADARAVIDELKRRYPGLPTLRGFDYGAIQSPLLFVHHRQDGCEHTPYASAASMAPRYELISVSGGKAAESGPCEAFAAHGYFGREAQTVDISEAGRIAAP